VSDSTPTLNEFLPTPKQWQVIHDIRTKYDYSLGTHEVLLDGAVGSAKSLLLGHIMVTHCILNPNAHAGIGRRTLPSLRETLGEVIKAHCADMAVEYNGVTGKYTFSNGSVLRPFSWADAHYKKFRSHEFSAFGIEELTENPHPEFYHEIASRVGRLRHIDEKLLISATNPDEPDSWVYKRFFIEQSERRHRYKSVTADNPYLPKSYIESLKENYDPIMYRRMVLSEWIPIRQAVIYHQYDPARNRVLHKYQVDPKREIHWSWDFNIGDGKPLSSCLFQYDGKFHVFKDLVIQGLRTEDMLEEAHAQGLLDHETTYVINGDCTGKNRDTRSRHNDYEIIRLYLSNAKTKSGRPIQFRMDVPLSNPKVRERHNIMNGLLHNANGDTRLFIYADAPVCHEAMMLTKLRSGADYIEDDSKNSPYQHVGTALGYGCIAKLREGTKSQVSMIRR